MLPWGDATEQTHSLRLAESIPDAVTPPRLSLAEAAAVIGVGTGLAHLAAALGAPTVGIYTATDPALTILSAGQNAVNLGDIGNAPDVAAVVDALRGMAAC